MEFRQDKVRRVIAIFYKWLQQLTMQTQDQQVRHQDLSTERLVYKTPYKKHKHLQHQPQDLRQQDLQTQGQQVPQDLQEHQELLFQEVQLIQDIREVLQIEWLRNIFSNIELSKNI